MRFVGVDLAWGGRRPSGLAVLDAGGRVVAEGWATTDEELSGFLAGHDRGGAVVALNAPLVVGNPAGTRRGCEAELQRRYGRVGAGPYPTNLGLLGGRVRAMELVRRSDRPYVTVPRDPGRRSGWWAVEVFPAPALVELGGLARAVRYKRGPPEARRAGLRAVAAILGGLGRGRPAAAARPGGGPGPGAGPAGPAAGRGAEGGRGPGRRPRLRVCGAAVVGPRTGRDPGRRGRRHRGHPGAPAGRLKGAAAGGGSGGGAAVVLPARLGPSRGNTQP